MQNKLISTFVVFFLFTACSGKDTTREDMKNLSASLLMDRAAERYSLYDYRGALAYYQAVIKNHPDKTEEVAWARYEIGYIYYIQKKYTEAKTYFEAASATQNAPHSVIILSEMMLRKITEKTVKTTSQ